LCISVIVSTDFDHRGDALFFYGDLEGSFVIFVRDSCLGFFRFDLWEVLGCWLRGFVLVLFVLYYSVSRVLLVFFCFLFLFGFCFFFFVFLFLFFRLFTPTPPPTLLQFVIGVFFHGVLGGFCFSGLCVCCRLVMDCLLVCTGLCRSLFFLE